MILEVSFILNLHGNLDNIPVIPVSSYIDLGLIMGPAAILANYQDKPREPSTYGTDGGSAFEVIDAFIDDYLTGPLLRIFESRNIKVPNGQDEYTERKILLDTVRGANDECKYSVFS